MIAQAFEPVADSDAWWQGGRYLSGQLEDHRVVENCPCERTAAYEPAVEDEETGARLENKLHEDSLMNYVWKAQMVSLI